MMTAAAQLVARPGARLSRLLVLLAVILFGLPSVHADGKVVDAWPTAQTEVEQTLGSPSATRYLLRAQLPGDGSPDALVPRAADHATPVRTAAAMSSSPPQSFLPFAQHVLPPVRGPPAV